ncbi:PREDICTED: mid1-interacting protein 1-B-like [Priapulus caudatus]|uniref:Mid1-interacting protein 1-B-like n=1 Tax=Priapulus caudatus TaxID=37621 RepID=A0ABM1DVG8_PRICU|nr:PREDICTED: mid1-interacting protein 1-B-like [Priapulus caudatus]
MLGIDPAAMTDKPHLRLSPISVTSPTREDIAEMASKQIALRKMSRQENVGSQNSLLVAMNVFVQAVDNMDNAIMVPRRLMDMPTASTSEAGHGGDLTCDTNIINGHDELNNNINIANSKLKSPGDLYGVYSMLKTVKRELVRGPTSDDDEDELVDEQPKKITRVFRQHLNGLFTVLNQLTDAAEILQGRYQEELDDQLTPCLNIDSRY